MRERSRSRLRNDEALRAHSGRATCRPRGMQILDVYGTHRLAPRPRPTADPMTPRIARVCGARGATRRGVWTLEIEAGAARRLCSPGPIQHAHAFSASARCHQYQRRSRPSGSARPHGTRGWRGFVRAYARSKPGDVSACAGHSVLDGRWKRRRARCGDCCWRPWARAVASRRSISFSPSASTTAMSRCFMVRERQATSSIAANLKPGAHGLISILR